MSRRKGQPRAHLALQWMKHKVNLVKQYDTPVEERKDLLSIRKLEGKRCLLGLFKTYRWSPIAAMAPRPTCFFRFATSEASMSAGSLWVAPGLRLMMLIPKRVLACCCCGAAPVSRLRCAEFIARRWEISATFSTMLLMLVGSETTTAPVSLAVFARQPSRKPATVNTLLGW